MWTRQTGRFRQEEMVMLEQMPASDLGAALLGSDPLVALRGLAEVKLNGDKVKLTALLRNEALTAHWRRFGSDRDVDARDRGYARALDASCPGRDLRADFELISRCM